MQTAATLLRNGTELGHLTVASVDIRADRLLRIQGYGDLGRVRPRIRQAAEYAAGLGMHIAEGKVAFRRLRITGLEGGRLELCGKHRFHTEAFARFLADCESVIAFVLTAGAGFDEAISSHMSDGRPVEGLFLDSAGWLAVESVTRQFADRLKGEGIGQGLRLTRRLGPGYSYRMEEGVVSWALDEQQALFSALGDSALPVSLLDSSAMQPKMSRSP